MTMNERLPQHERPSSTHEILDMPANKMPYHQIQSSGHQMNDTIESLNSLKEVRLNDSFSTSFDHPKQSSDIKCSWVPTRIIQIACMV